MGEISDADIIFTGFFSVRRKCRNSTKNQGKSMSFHTIPNPAVINNPTLDAIPCQLLIISIYKPKSVKLNKKKVLEKNGYFSYYKPKLKLATLIRTLDGKTTMCPHKHHRREKLPSPRAWFNVWCGIGNFIFAFKSRTTQWISRPGILGCWPAELRFCAAVAMCTNTTPVPLNGANEHNKTPVSTSLLEVRRISSET